MAAALDPEVATGAPSAHPVVAGEAWRPPVSGAETGPARDASGDGIAGSAATHPWTPAPRGWYAAVAAGVFPPLLLGFAASALANRLAFAGWGMVAGLGHALLLRAAWNRGWGVAARAALALAWAALTLVSFASLVARHGESLDLGYRALLWPVYASALTAPPTWSWAAAALGATAAASALLARRRGRREGRA